MKPLEETKYQKVRFKYLCELLIFTRQLVLGSN